MKRVSACLLGMVILSLFTSTVFAWEFTLRTEFEYRTRYWSRIGSKDLFGMADANGRDAASGMGLPIGLSGPSIYSYGAPVNRNPQGNGRDPSAVMLVRNGFAEADCDAHITDMRMTFFLNLRAFKVVNLFTRVNFGGYRYAFGQTRQQIMTTTGRPFQVDDPRYQILYPGLPPYERYYMASSSVGAYNTASLPSVEEMKAVIRLPIGNLVLGTRGFALGTGATYGHNDRDDSIMLQSEYGPFLFQAYVFPFRQRIGPYRLHEDKRGGSLWQAYWQNPDPNVQSQYYLGSAVKYRQGTMEIGIGAFFERQHIRDAPLRLPFSVYVPLVPPEHVPIGSRDYDWHQVLIWTKYNNGRFFLNAEYAWENGDHRVNAQVYEFNHPTYTEGYHAFVETGAMAGPVKLSFMWAQASGPDRGTRDQNPTKIYAAFPINYQALEPYNYLMFNTYGGGTLGNPNRNNWFGNSVHPDGTGQMTDARALACRVDFAPAANLNLWGSFMWAERLERNGYWAGQFGSGNWYAGDQVSNGFPGNENAAEARAWKAANLGGQAEDYNPYVDDGAIGWEAGFGIDWKLLEGVTFRARYAFWQPGAWFDQALMAITTTPLGLDGLGLMTGRSPIHAISNSFLVEF